MTGAIKVPPKYPATGIAAWKTAKAMGMAIFLEIGMSGSHRVLDKVTAMASMASAMPKTMLSTKEPITAAFKFPPHT